MSNLNQKPIRYRHEPVADSTASATHIQGETVAVGNTYHLDSEAQFKRDLEQSLAEIVKKRLQEAEDEAIGLVQIAERTAENNARQIADEILAKANAQAKEMVETAQSQVDSIKETAHEDGFKMGFQEGYADATAQVEQESVGLLRSAQMLSENAYQAERLVLKNYEKNAVALIGHLARKVLRRELADSPETLLNLVQQAVESLYLSGKIKVVVNPQVLQELRAFSAVTEAAVEQMSRFEFIVDPLLDVTQIFIVSEEGAFDLSPDNQVAQLLAPLEAAISLPRPEHTETASTTIENAGFSIEADGTIDNEISSILPESLIPEGLTEIVPEADTTPAMVNEEASSPDEVSMEMESPEKPDDEADLLVEPVSDKTPEVKPYQFQDFDNLKGEAP